MCALLQSLDDVIQRGVISAARWIVRVIDDLQSGESPPESRSSSAPSRARGSRRGPPQAHNAFESNPSPNFEFVAGSRRCLDIAPRGTSGDPQWLVVPPWSARRECTTPGAGRSRPDFQPMDPGNSSRLSSPVVPQLPGHGFRQVVSISIDLWHEMRKGRDLSANRSRRALDSPRVGTPRKRREPVTLNRDQGLVAESWVLAGRWWCAVGRPLVPRAEEPSHDVGVRRRIVQLLPTTSLASP